MVKKKQKDQDLDLEEDWKKLREKLKINLDKKEDSEEEGLEEDVEQAEQEISSEQFSEFLQGTGEFKAPVLERVQTPQQQEQVPNLEDLDIPFTPISGPETDQTTATTTKDQPEYIMGMENPYEQSQAHVEPPVLRPRDTMPQQEIPRHELLERGWSMTPVRVRGNVYPDVLEEEKKEDPDYYKLVK